MRAKRFICIMRLAMLMVEESHKMITLGEFFRAFCTLLVLLKEGINGARPNVKSWGILMHNRPGGWVWKCALSALNVGKVGFPPQKKRSKASPPLLLLSFRHLGQKYHLYFLDKFIGEHLFVPAYISCEGETICQPFPPQCPSYIWAKVSKFCHRWIS